MTEQRTFTEEEYGQREKLSRRDRFLTQMDKILPWAGWMEMISPHYPQGGNGRPMRGIETMLRMYLLQIWFGMSDVGTEEAIEDSISMRNFMKLGSGERVPDATTLLKFSHLLECHEIAKQMFEDIKNRLERNGLMMRGGTIVDATIIEALNSTRNQKHERDPEMSSTKKGWNWHYGMKVHSAVDAASGYVKKIVATTASESDISQAHKLIAEDDRVVYGDSGYVGIKKREEIKNLVQSIDFQIVSHSKAIRERYKKYHGYKWDRAIERRKSEIRCFVEHPFLYVKRRFWKTMYRGIAKKRLPPPPFQFNLGGSMRLSLLVVALSLLLSGCSSEEKKNVDGFDISPLINEKSISIAEVADRDPVNLWGIEYPTKEELLSKWKPWLKQLDNVIVIENMSDEQLDTLECLYFYFIRSLGIVGGRLFPEGQTSESTRNLILNLAKGALQSLKKIESISGKKHPEQSTVNLSAEYDLKNLIVLNAVASMVYAKIEYPDELRKYYGSLGHRNDASVKSIEFFEEKVREIVEQLDESRDENIYVNVLEDMIPAHRTLFDELYRRLYFDFQFYSPDQPTTKNKDFEQRKKRFLEYLQNACINKQNKK